MQLEYAQHVGYPASSSAWADYPVLRSVLAPEYAMLPADDLDALIARTLGPGTSADDLEGIFDDIGRSFSGAGHSIGQVAGQAAPYAAPALTGAMSGAMAGSSLGPYGMLGGALIGGTLGVLGAANQPPAGQRAPAPTPQPSAPVPQPAALPPAVPPAQPVTYAQPLPPAPAMAPTQGPPPTQASPASPAAATLMGLLARPEVLQALMAMLMGGMGRSSVSAGAGGPQVPVAQVGQLVGMLGTQASAEFAAVNPAAGHVKPRYLMDSMGEFIVDPAVSEQVSEHVLRLFRDSVPAAWPGSAGPAPSVRLRSDEDALVELYDTLDRIGLTSGLEPEYSLDEEYETDEAMWEVTADE